LVRTLTPGGAVSERAGKRFETKRAGSVAGRGIAAERGVTMAVKLTKLGTRRFIGDTATMLVHDRWNGNCEDCLLELLIQAGTARGFNPDASDQAFWEDYEYCPNCFDRTEPARPDWAVDAEPAIDEETATDEASTADTEPEAKEPVGTAVKRREPSYR